MQLWKYMVEFLFFSSEDQCEKFCLNNTITVNGSRCTQHDYIIFANDVIGVFHTVSNDELNHIRF